MLLLPLLVLQRHVCVDVLNPCMILPVVNMHLVLPGLLAKDSNPS